MERNSGSAAAAAKSAPAAARPSLEEQVGKYYDDPLGFVLDCFEWGQGDLAGSTGPDEMQRDFLDQLGREVRAKHGAGGHSMPIRMAESSGHGTGKSVLGAWIVCWILSTRPWSQGTVTAGTAQQLEARTWAAIKTWMARCVTAHWFVVQSDVIYIKPELLRPGQVKDDWKVTAMTCKPENAQNFAGQHAERSTSFFIFDEASRVPDEIYKVAYGGLIDGEPMIFVWGQMERNSGEFYEICFGKLRDRWNITCIDSRQSRFANQPLIAEWLRDYGEDSDWFRVRVRGLAPRASELQYIDRQRVEEAGERAPRVLPSDPLIAGVDVSGGGSAWNVVRFRRGLDARSIAPIRIPGEHGREREVLIAQLARLLADERPERRIAMMFIDAAFGAPVVERLHVLGFKNVVEVNFGEVRTMERRFANMRAYMYSELRDWLLKGSIDPQDIRLIEDLTAPGYKLRTNGSLVLEAKSELLERLGRSPDDGDALALTFAQQVAPLDARPWQREYATARRPGGAQSWMA